MTLLREINILQDKKLLIQLNSIACVLIFPFLALFTYLGILFYRGQEVTFSLGGLAMILVIFFLLLVIHEFIHGIFIKIFAPKGKIRFGFKIKSMMAYATSPGSFYDKKQMLTIALAPFLLLSILLTFLFCFGVIDLGQYILLASFHASGCVGDFYYSYLILWTYRRQDVSLEDTENGLRIYEK